MWTWMASLFSSKKNVERVVESAATGFDLLAQGVDHIKYSDEEKAEYILERIKAAEKDSDIRNISRRILAFLIVGECVFLTNLIIFLILIGSDKAEAIKPYLLFWATPLSVVVGFYFFYFGMQSIVKSAKKGSDNG